MCSFLVTHYRENIDKVESSKKSLKLIPQLLNKLYEGRLRELSLFSLESQRMRGGLIELFKMFRGFDNININNYLIIYSTITTRINGYRIISKCFRSNEDKHKSSMKWKCLELSPSIRSSQQNNNKNF